MPSRLEPAHLLRCDGKRPDGITMTPWSQGTFLVWVVMCTDTLSASNLRRSATEASVSTAHAESLKVTKYAHLSSAYHCVPIAVETLGAYGPEAAGFFKSLGQRLQRATMDLRAGEFLVQWISVAIQRGNVLSILGSLNSFAPLDDFD